MSALPPKADIDQRLSHVRFVPEADIASFIRSPVGALLELQRYVETQRFRGLEIYHKVILCRRLHRQVTRPFSLENAVNI